MHLNAKGTFFNKKPLEVFAFDSPAFGGIPNIYTLTKVPTSKQSKDFDDSVYKVLNDFKYLGIDLIPTFSIKRKIRFDVGIGFFYKRLINSEEVIVRRDDLPVFDFLFEPPFYVFGEVHYGKNEWGWLSNMSISLPISDTVSIGLEWSVNSYFNGMHPQPYPKDAIDNPKWIVFTSGLNVQYSFKKK